MSKGRAVFCLGATLAALSPAGAAAAASRAAVPPSCKLRLESAREQLIRAGFAPTPDKDTRRWLQVDEYPGVGLGLKLEMRTSADGAATSYNLGIDVNRSTDAHRTRWRHHRGKYCCDDNAAPEDHLFEFRWTRVSVRLRAIVSIVEFEDDVRDPAQIHLRDMFGAVARAAADDCLASGAP